MCVITQNEGTTSHYQLTLATEHPIAIAEIQKLPGILTITPPLPTEPRYTLTIERHQVSLNTILQTALTAGAQITAFTEETRHLNQAFMDLTEPGVRPE